VDSRPGVSRTFSDERNLVSSSAPWIVMAVRGTSVDATKPIRHSARREDRPTIASASDSS
jgi:hypothetical protein